MMYKETGLLKHCSSKNHKQDGLTYYHFMEITMFVSWNKTYTDQTLFY